jgi:hypothetical protein
MPPHPHRFRLRAFSLIAALFPLLAVLLAAAPTSGREARAELVDNPAATGVTDVAPPPVAEIEGWRVYRHAGSQSRELVQLWTASGDAPLHGFEIAIQSGSNSPLTGSRLLVELSTSAPGRAVPFGPLPELVLSTEVELPTNPHHRAYHRGRWLRVTFPPVEQKAGRPYALRLAFARETPQAQEIVFAVAPHAADAASSSGFRQDGGEWKVWRKQARTGSLRMHLLRTPPGAETASPAPAPRVLRVDPRDPAAIPGLAAAAKIARPGDVIWLAPGSGPYREELHITASGTADAPITVEGNYNEITGFDPLRFKRTPDGGHVADIAVKPPFVLRHQGERLREDPATGDFTGGASYSPETRRLTLAPGVSPDGWEVSTRTFAVRLLNVSHHRYRNLTASGALNDGFNLHGAGSGLHFENIVGCHNLDEGFSAHGDMHCEIVGGRFFGNDNGVYNIDRSRAVLRDVDIWENLGLGLGVKQGHIDVRNVRVWANGMAQFLVINDGETLADNLLVYRNPHTTRPWISHKESAKWTTPTTLNEAASRVAGLNLIDAAAPRAQPPHTP